MAAFSTQPDARQYTILLNADVLSFYWIWCQREECQTCALSQDEYFVLFQRIEKHKAVAFPMSAVKNWGNFLIVYFLNGSETFSQFVLNKNQLNIFHYLFNYRFNSYYNLSIYFCFSDWSVWKITQINGHILMTCAKQGDLHSCLSRL